MTRRLCRWDETKAPGSVGLEQSYEYVDMLGVCAWLNILVRKSKDVGIACIAQSVNVVSLPKRHFGFYLLLWSIAMCDVDWAVDAHL